MYIMDSNQYAIELVTYLLVLVVYFYELIVYMLFERNAFDSIAFFSQCRIVRKHNKRLIFYRFCHILKIMKLCTCIKLQPLVICYQVDVSVTQNRDSYKKKLDKCFVYDKHDFWTLVLITILIKDFNIFS